jgi:hypothetical protein
MAKHFVTFGQSHAHTVMGKKLNKDTVACFNAANAAEGRDKAFEYFGDKFFTDYHGDEFKIETLHYFPEGIVEIEKIK